MDEKHSAAREDQPVQSDLGQVTEQGHASQQEDHKMTKWECIKKNPLNIFWMVFGVWTLIVISFDNQAGGMVVSIPEFRKDYGHAYKDEYVIDADWQSAFSGGPTASSVVGSLVAAWLADRFGRKWVIFSGVALTFVGVALEFVSTEVKLFFAGKFLNGFSLGILTTTCLTWVSEIAPLPMRGLMTGLCNVAFCIGPFVVALIANTTANWTNAWSYRALFAAQWGFGATSILLAPFMPESPWYREVPLDLVGVTGLKEAIFIHENKQNKEGSGSAKRPMSYAVPNRIPTPLQQPGKDRAPARVPTFTFLMNSETMTELTKEIGKTCSKVCNLSLAIWSYHVLHSSLLQVLLHFPSGSPPRHRLTK